MKICPICHSQVGDESYYCTMCGNRLPEDAETVPNPPQPWQQIPYQPAAPVFNPYDHTAEFDAKDVSENKLYALLMYLSGIVGIFLALLGAKESAYARFHLRQNLKLLVVELLLGLLAAVSFFTVIGPIAAGVCLVIVEVIRLIAFFQTAAGKSKEPAIIRSLKFLK